jgi:mannose-6-phosphate isomerase
MSDLYPLLMTPLFDPRPWGTHNLSPIYSQQFKERIGESWLTGDKCKVQNGPLAGKSLAELASQYKRELVGDAPDDDNRFPLLAKFLFPHEKLSVQVHPDDAAARGMGLPCGKTECWYVAQADPGAEIGLGLKSGVTVAQFADAIGQNRAEECLNWIKVFAGDMIYVAGGTVHTLGPGSIIVETQQQSDTTFRLYDYGRPRELHLKEGLRVIKEKAASGKVKPRAYGNLDRNGNHPVALVVSTYFVVQRFDLEEKEGASEFSARDRHSVQILVAIDGAGVLHAPDCDPVHFGKGDAVVVPAAIPQFRIQPQPRIDFLKSFVPGVPLPDPETTP